MSTTLRRIEITEEAREVASAYFDTGWILYDANDQMIDDWPEGWPDEIDAAWLRARGIEVKV